MASSENSAPVLVAYDGSAFADAAIDEVAGLLGPGRRLVVLTVSEPMEGIPFLGSAGVPIDSNSMDAVLAAARSGAEATAERGCDRARELGLEPEAKILTGGPTWERIVAGAEEVEAELIAIGSRGLSGVKHVLLGSVAAAVAQHSRRSVLIVHAPAAE
jgi:nucleotide-binding universal stress UspA family protein